MAQHSLPFARSLIALSALACLVGGCSSDDDDTLLPPVLHTPPSDSKPPPVAEPPVAEPPGFRAPPVQPCGRTGAPPGEAFARARYGLAGHWVGTATPSFMAEPWPVEITFRPDGSYTAVRYGEETGNGPLHYGEVSANSVTGTYELLDLTDNGEASGEIGVPFSGDRLLIGTIARVALDESLGSLSFVFMPSWNSSGTSPRITYELSCVPEPGPSVTPAQR